MRFAGSTTACRAGSQPPCLQYASAANSSCQCCTCGKLQWFVTSYRILTAALLMHLTGKGKGRQGKARQGKARQGKARQGKARQGKARQGTATRLAKLLAGLHRCCLPQLAGKGSGLLNCSCTTCQTQAVAASRTFISPLSLCWYVHRQQTAHAVLIMPDCSQFKSALKLGCLLLNVSLEPHVTIS